MKKFIQTMLTVTNCALFLSACVQGNIEEGPMRGHIVSSMTGTSQDVLVQAVKDIEAASGEAFMSDEGSEYPIYITYGQLTGLQIGLATTNLEDGCKIQIDPQMNPETSKSWTVSDLRHTLIHEIGHCFGLSHDPDSKQIMFREYHSDQNTPKSFQYFIQKINASRGLVDQ